MSGAGGTGAPGVRITEVDGVPAVWADIAGPFTGALLLRVGHADETLATRGHTHMLEHLALHGLDRPGEHSNGHVDATTTLLHATGTPEEVAEFLARAARQLLDPPVVRLADEKGVLRAEAARRSRALLTDLLIWRWGTVTYGLEVAEELGLAAMTADSVRHWGRRWVHRGNAVLWFSGPPPAGLRLGLPDGERVLPPDPHLSPLPAFPAYFHAPAGIAALHGLLPRSTAGSALAAVLQSRLVDDLRLARAAAYSPEAGYQRLTGDTAAVVAASDVVDGRAAEVTDRFMAALGELISSEGVPTEEELAAHRSQVRRGLESPAAALGMVGSTAWDLLHGGPMLALDEVLDEVDRLTPDMVGAAGRDLAAGLLVQVPVGVPVPRPWTPAPLSPAAPVRGGRTFSERGGDARLVVADAGVTLLGTHASLTVRYDRLSAVARWDDGGRSVIGTDGVRVVVEPTLWRDGGRAVALIDHATPPHLAVALGHREERVVPRPPSAWARLRHPSRTTAAIMTFLVWAAVVTAATVWLDEERAGALSLATIAAVGVIVGASRRH